MGDYYTPRFIDGELIPSLKLGDESFETSSPVFPPRIRDGVVHVYVGYLSSFIWPGRVEMSEDAALIEYADSTWGVTDDWAKATVNDRTRTFQESPRRIAGYLYLPSEMVTAITGWEVKYSEGDNTVHLLKPASDSGGDGVQ
jgi:hypothetical protein